MNYIGFKYTEDKFQVNSRDCGKHKLNCNTIQIKIRQNSNEFIPIQMYSPA